MSNYHKSFLSSNTKSLVKCQMPSFKCKIMINVFCLVMQSHKSSSRMMIRMLVKMMNIDIEEVGEKSLYLYLFLCLYLQKY